MKCARVCSVVSPVKLPLAAGLYFGIVEPLPYRVKGGKAAKNEELSKRALSEIDVILEKLN